MNNSVMKKRLILIMKLLREQTDQEHSMNTYEILKYLEEHGISTNRKTLKSDLDVLVDCNMDIITIQSKPNKYYWGDRVFELPELQLLVDAVLSSRFITKKKSKVLVEKLSALASTNQKRELNRHLYATNRIKPRNESIFYIVNDINYAISRKQQISFKYYEYAPEKKKVYRNDGEVYLLSPYALFWNDDFYYVVGWSEKHNNVSVFRMDRMAKVEIIDKVAIKKPREFKIDDYSKRIFEMYDGETVSVKLECKNELMKYIVDRFGEDIETKINSDKTFITTVDVALSPTFYSWVFRFGGDIRILSPAQAIGKIISMANELVKVETI